MNAKVMKEVIPSTSLNLVAEKQVIPTPTNVVFTFKEQPIYVVAKFWPTGYSTSTVPRVYSAPHGWEMVRNITLYNITSSHYLLDTGISHSPVNVRWDYQDNSKQIRVLVSTDYSNGYTEIYGIYFS